MREQVSYHADTIKRGQYLDDSDKESLLILFMHSSTNGPDGPA